MTPTVGIFFDRGSAEHAVGNLRAVGLSPARIHVLVPETTPLAAKVQTSELLSLGGAAWAARSRTRWRAGFPGMSCSSTKTRSGAAAPSWS